MQYAIAVQCHVCLFSGLLLRQLAAVVATGMQAVRLTWLPGSLLLSVT